MRKTPKIIVAVILLILVGWGGFWLVGSSATEKLLAGWFEDRRDEGWTADYTSLTTRGFPNRFDTTITDLNLADPETGIAWSAPVFQTLSLSYRPTDVIAIFPGEQVFATRDARHLITAETFRASASLAPSVELPISRSVVEIDNARISAADGTETTLDHAQIAMRETPDRQGHVYDIDLSASGIRPDPSSAGAMRRAGALAEKIEQATLRATIRFDNPWDRYAIERARPQPREIELTRLAARWGEVELDATGVLVVSDSGLPEGTLDIRAQNWRALLAVADETGWLPAALLTTLSKAAELAARLSGDPDTLEATLRFEHGLAFLGPLPVGAAPLIRLP